MVKEIKKKYGVVLWLLIFVAEATSLLSIQGQSQAQIQAQESSSLPLEDIHIFSEVFGKIKDEYVDEIDDATLFRYAIQGMLSGLDSHSIFLDQDSLKKFKRAAMGRFGGLGIEIALQDGIVKVVVPNDSSPAFDAGIQSGDLILMIDDVRMRGMSLNDVAAKIRGDPGSTIKLTISRQGVSKYLDIKLVRTITKTNNVEGKILENGLGYVRLSSFHRGTAQSLRAKINKLNDKSGEGRLHGLVLDLRNNPGGILAGAIAVSDMFITEGEIVSTRGRAATSNHRFVARPGDIIDGAPIVVLVNGGSASASEIVAGALQDHQRATILGTKTFGKGSVQTIIPIHNGNALKLTTARYYTPSNISIQATAIIPDIIVAQTDYMTIPKTIHDEATGNKNSQIRESDLVGHLESGQSKDGVVADETPNKKNIQKSETIKKDRQLREALNLLKWMVLTKRRTPIIGG